jgi:IS30 family transposase
MKRRPRIRYTEEQKALMWDRWQQGESLHAIAGLEVTPISWTRG